MGSRTSVIAVVALGLVTVTGCSAESDRQGSGADAGLSVVGPFELHSLDPSTAEGFFTRLGVAETLVEAEADGELRPGLATRWRSSADQRQWRFTIRPTATFHDGTEVTAADVTRALDTALDDPASVLASAPVERIAASGPDTVRIDLAEPFAPLPAVLAHTSTQILGPRSYDEQGKVTRVVGSGPYRVVEVEQPARVEVATSEHWDGDRPEIDRVTYEAVGRAESRALMAESGQADVVLGMDPVGLQRVADAEHVDVESVTLPRTIQLKVNSDHEILGDVRVRRALSLALDREAMATALLRDPEMAATQLFPPSLPQWHQDDLAPLDHDLTQAGDLLQQAGWEPGDGGVLEREGRPFTVTLTTFPDRPELPVIATAIQEQLAELGVAVDVQVGNSSEIPAGHQDGSLELALYARNFSLVPDPLVTLLQDFSPEGADWGAMGWHSPALTSTLRGMTTGTAGGSESESAAATRRARVAGILQRQMPVVPVAWYRQSAVVNERVDGFTLDPLERSWLLDELSWAR